MAGLSDAKPNQFVPLTPEQQAMLDRDKIEESLGPFDWMPGGFTAMGAAVGGAALPFVAKAWPWYMRHYGTKKGLGYAAQEGGMLVGGSALPGYGLDLKDRMFSREDREKQMMFGNPADAEGQPGGFYGRKR